MKAALEQKLVKLIKLSPREREPIELLDLSFHNRQSLLVFPMRFSDCRNCGYPNSERTRFCLRKR